MLYLAAIAGFLAPKFDLTIESIMRGPQLVGHAPRELRWTRDGSALSFSWAKADGTPDPAYHPFHVNRDGTGLAPGDAKDSAPSPPDGPEPTSVSIKDGDIYLYDAATQTTKQLTHSKDPKSDPKLADGGTSVIYFSGQDLYRVTVADSKITHLTQIVNSGTTPAPTDPKTTVITSPKGYRAGTLSLSPKGDHAFIQFTEELAPARRAEVPRYISASGYPEMIETYPRPGAPSAQSRAEIIDLTNGTAIDATPPRPARLQGLRWSPNGQHAILVERSLDHKDEWIMGLDPKTDKLTQIYDEHSDAWVGGPGRATIGWYPDSSRLYLVSENSGYANLYSITADGGTPTPLAQGQYEVRDVRLDEKRSRLTFVSSEGGPGIRHLDTVNLDGTGKRKLADLSADDDTAYAIAPDGEQVAVVRSRPNRPGELFVNGVQVTTTPSAEWLAGPWIDPPVVMVPSTDGVLVPSRFYRPNGWRRGGPAVIFVHGAGYLQNVFDGWSHYYREYMFNQFLMAHGYCVLDMDYRGSAGYGEKWRTAIYRHMGGKDLDDEVAGAQWLVQHEGVAKDRVGIYGGSYGGFMTEMAMFTRPGVFAAGAALRPVADWGSYNIGYTTEILDDPKDDPDGYRISSPINFCEGLQGALLICHGMVDTNVAFQDSVRVAEKLIELGKTNWEIAPYPVENHDFQKATSWTDEYRRVFDLFERTIGSKRTK